MSWPAWIGIAVVAEATEQLLNRLYLSKISQYWEFLLGYSFAAVLISLVLLSGDAHFAKMTGGTFLLLLLSGVFWFFTYLFNARAYQQVEVSLTSLLMQIQVVLVFFGGIVLFAEPLTIGKLFGTALIVGGISLRGTSFGRASPHGLMFKLLAIVAGAAGFLTDKKLTALTAPAMIQLWSYIVPTLLIVILQPSRIATAYRLARDLNFANLGVGAINALVAYALLHAFAAADVSTVYPLYQVYTLLTILAAHFLLREADVLSRIGFRVAGWSRTAKRIPGIETFHGDGDLDAFLARTEILVSLLPCTARTEGILNRALFRKLKRDGALGGAVLINAGRGKLQIDADIVDALDEGVLSAATLDVFATEPLAGTSPLWAHPKITVTPHNAALSDARSMALNMLKQIERFERGLPFENVVDRGAGY